MLKKQIPICLLSYFYRQSVVGQLHSLGECSICLVDKSDVVAHVGEEHLLGACLACKLEGLVHEHVGMVRLGEAKGIYHQIVNVLQIVDFSLRYGLHVSYVGEPTYLVSQYRQLVVHHL